MHIKVIIFFVRFVFFNYCYECILGVYAENISVFLLDLELTALSQNYNFSLFYLVVLLLYITQKIYILSNI